MNCSVPQCKGITTNGVCSAHGRTCDECGGIALSTGLCFRCQSRADGVKCSTCGSPWVYISAYPDDRPLCRVCMLNLIQADGLNKGMEEWVASWRAEEAAQKARQEKSDEESKKIAEMDRKIKSRRKPKTEDMFEDES